MLQQKLFNMEGYQNILMSNLILLIIQAKKKT